MTKLALDEWYAARDYVVTYVEKSLAGPGKEVPLKNPPLNEILIGILYPLDTDETDTETLLSYPYQERSPNTDSDFDSSPDDNSDGSLSTAYSNRPSCIGLTFAVDSSAGTSYILLTARAISYSKNSVDSTWSPTLVSLDEPIRIETTSSKNSPIKVAITDGLELTALVRPPYNGVVRITATLSNTNGPAPKGEMDSFCWFQPEIKVTTPDGEFIDGGPTTANGNLPKDIAATNFLYRNSKNLAAGHGCACTWEDDTERINELKTTFFPRQEVQLSNPSGGSESDPYGSFTLKMNGISEPAGIGELVKLADAYENWIEKRTDEIGLDPTTTEQQFSQAEENLNTARKCLARIRTGISLVSKQNGNTDIGLAFRLMNQAMALQRFGLRPKTYEPEWRPFQVAFILMNLAGLSGEDPDERDIADLLWFPTGGGKTEAYLGCIAFSIFLRRIKDPRDGGVSAIMRYTLRLLTTDQFERAAALICGLEIVRQRKLPETCPISLGMWVGKSTTPNTLKDANHILSKLASGQELKEGSTPVQLLSCPWCGESLNYRNYFVTKDGMRICCGNITCDFHKGLPLYVVDEDVYRVRPSLVIGTVDKFAQMTWRSEVSQLLSMDGGFSAPDLIVQDELHLITGPLGTMVGLYESALDTAIVGTNKLRPKILASTATIRRAEQQVKAVFDRRASQFPPPGLDPSDNYFSRAAARQSKGTREYVGIFAPGQSQTTQLVWVYAAALQAVESLNAPAEVKDAYWTLLGYFNSLRVLGSAYIQTVDDVPKKVESIAGNNSERARNLSNSEPLELTSRVPSTEIPTIRSQMENEFKSGYSPNIVLATNMISVGLDIDRLGLMVVAGQPQDSSEYIQATSRVGRQHPGLVFIAYNSSKTRDVSHFESFIPFHRSLYRAVEATTVTPFSARARDRGAHAVLVATARMLIDELRADSSVVNATEFKDEITYRVISPLVARCERVAPEEAESFRRQLNSRLNDWCDAVISQKTKRYGAMKTTGAEDQSALLTPAQAAGGTQEFGEANHTPPWQTLTSLRNVDAETQFSEYLTRTGDE